MTTISDLLPGATVSEKKNEGHESTVQVRSRNCEGRKALELVAYCAAKY
jgi:hypothetical protein